MSTEHDHEHAHEHDTGSETTGFAGEGITHISQSALRELTIHHGTMTQSAALNLVSEDVALHESSVGMLQGDQVAMYDSAAALAIGNLTVREGKASVFMHIGTSDCSIRPVLNTWSALAAGAGIGFGFALLNSLVHRRGRGEGN